MKKKIFLIVVILIVFIGVFLFIQNNKEIKNIKNKYNSYLKEYSNNFEYGDKIKYEELKQKLVNKKIDKKSEVIIYIDDKKIDKNYSFNKIGKYKIKTEIIYNYKKFLFSKKIKTSKINKIEVKDTNYPILNLKNKDIYVGEEINLDDLIGASDKVDGKLKYKIDGDYDINKVGTYKLTVFAKDKNDNESTGELVITVKAKNSVPVKNNDKKILSGTTSKGFKIENKDGVYYINGILIANKTYDLPSSYAPGGLLDIFMKNYNKLKEDALKEGVNLNIISGYRSYSRQSTLYNNYAARDGYKLADTYSARPGHSEHQTGLAADVNSLDQSFENTKEGKWLNENCYKYGFIIRYPKGKENITGYIFEPWHIRYVGDIASKLYNNGNWISLEEYLGIDSKYD